jgi:heme/copper-type cytochrome/quinol oxidase subunit 2
MFNKIINKLALSFSLLVLMLFPVLTPAAASAAEIKRSLCTGSDLKITSNPDAGSCQNVNDPSTGAEKQANDLIKSIVNILSSIVGVLAVIMLIFEGFRYVTSGGNTETVGKAKNTILYAIVGLLIVAFAQLIVHFVLSQTSQASSGGAPSSTLQLAKR